MEHGDFCYPSLAIAGIITGVMLAFARVAGETAPLIFTAFGNQFWSFKSQPTRGCAAVTDFRLRYPAL